MSMIGTVQYGYLGAKTTVTDEAGNPRRYTYDGLGRMTQVEEPNPTLATPLVTAYAYNVLGKLTQTTQGSQTRTFVLDSLGRMTSQTLPESGTTSFTYDSEDQLLTKTDARGITVTMTYGTSGGSIHQGVMTWVDLYSMRCYIMPVSRTHRSREHLAFQLGPQRSILATD